MDEIEGHDCTGGKIDGRLSVSICYVLSSLNYIKNIKINIFGLVKNVSNISFTLFNL
jgi:hypothetical protein